MKASRSLLYLALAGLRVIGDPSVHAQMATGSGMEYFAQTVGNSAKGRSVQQIECSLARQL